MNKNYMLYCIFAAVIFMYGCGNSSSAVNSQKENGIKQEEITYAAQSILLPEYVSLDAAYSDGNELYYAATGLNQNTQQYETAFYALKQGEAAPEEKFRLAENQRVQDMTMDAEGNIYYLSYEEIMGEDGDNQRLPDLMLYKADQKGVLLQTLDLTEYTRGPEQTMFQGVAVDGEKNIVLFTQNQTVLVFDQRGSKLFETRAEGRIFDICSSNGKVFIGYAAGSGMAIRGIDVPGKKLSPKQEYNIPGNQFYLTANRSGNLLIASEESVYQYAVEEESIIKKFDWQTYDLSGISAGILLPFGENGVMMISRSYGAALMKTEVTAFREAAEGEGISQEKTVITLGVPYHLLAGLKSEVVYFNKANPDIKIEVKNYNEDYARLNTEIMAGTGPDLLVMPSNRINQFAESGVLEDLNPYFAEDKTLDRGDFLENILKAFETEGHLYSMPINFDIYTMVGKTSVVGEQSGWNIDEMIAFAESVPEGRDIFDNTSKSGVLRLLKYAYTDQLVDTDDTGNPLNRELLLKMLRFSNQFEHDDQFIYDSNLVGKIKEEQVLLLDTEVYAGVGYFGYASLLGEQATFIGFPAEAGNGHLIYSMNIFAINSRSEHKDIAWKFISTLLSKEAQMRMEDDYTTKGFHTRKDVLEEHLAWAMENSSLYCVKTINGEYYTYRDIQGEITEKDIQQIRDLIQNTDKALMISADIDQIIEEEASFYFSGTKPVEEVVDVIENRVRTYVNETK